MKERIREFQALDAKPPTRHNLALKEEKRRQYKKDLFSSGRNDYRKYIEQIINEIEKSIDKGDYKSVFQGVRKLTGKGRSKQRDLTKASDGKLIENSLERAAVWKEVAEKKFAQTDAEKDREEMEDLGPPSTRKEDELTREEFDLCLHAQKSNKAVGEDKVPIEAWRKTKAGSEELYQLCKAIWEEEVVPEEFTKGNFITIFKNKGSSEDPGKYRYICLLNHAYKVLSTVVLKRMVETADNFLPETLKENH